MNYRSITDKPAIQTRIGVTVWICQECRERKYTNESSAKLACCACSECGESRECSLLEKRTLRKRAPKKKVDNFKRLGVVRVRWAHNRKETDMKPLRP